MSDKDAHNLWEVLWTPETRINNMYIVSLIGHILAHLRK